MITASDGRLDSLAPASVALLVIDPGCGERRDLQAAIPQELLDRWSHKEQCIVHAEQAALVMAVFGHNLPVQGGMPHGL